MNTEMVRTLSFENLKTDPNLIEYVDENIIILNQVDTSFSPDAPIKLDCFMMAFRFEGEVNVNINNKMYQLQADHCAVLLPNTIIRHVPIIGKCKMRIIAFSSQCIKSLVGIRKEIWDISAYLHNNPLYPMKKEISYRLYLYKELEIDYMNEQECPFGKEIKKHLFSAILCELFSSLYKLIPHQEKKLEFKNDRSIYIYRKFIEKVNEDDGSNRSVSYYADKLCYSPKHLSTVIKKISGKTPLTIINGHAMDCIKFQLKHSHLSMKEIADMFNFANPSFFGKFVRQHLGMSPQQYRNSNEE